MFMKGGQSTSWLRLLYYAKQVVGLCFRGMPTRKTLSPVCHNVPGLPRNIDGQETDQMY